MNKRNELLSAIQSHVARIAVGPSTVRGQGVPGVVEAARSHLRSIDLRQFGCANDQQFQARLNKATDRLQSELPRAARSWGVARKVLNIFLRDSLYNFYLRNAYHLELAESSYELPLDSITARELKRGTPRGRLPAWPGVKRVTADLSERYQEVADERAVDYGVTRVHLDSFLWSASRDP